MSNPIKNRTNTIFIHVSNLQRSVQWYSKLLGEEVDVSKVADPVHNLKMDQNTGITLDAGPPGMAKDIQPLPYPLFNFHTDDIYQAYDYLQELGFQIESDIVEFDDFFF
ncbi:VOC family protein [Oceanobacillus sp. 1P07AA]|uniref:VOC family protein n=1 Tax=Oceanobacillus sp. 1P07AA TaxID=3132293 RepID=UPI0039A5333E